MQHQHAIGAHGFEAAATSGSPPQLSFRTIRQQFRRALSAAATRQQLCDGTTAPALCNTCACGSAFSAISDSQRRAASSTYSSPAALHLRRFPHATSATHRHSLSATAASASEGSSSLQSWSRQLDLHCIGVSDSGSVFGNTAGHSVQRSYSALATSPASATMSTTRLRQRGSGSGFYLGDYVSNRPACS